MASTSSNLPQPTLETPNNAGWYTSSNRISGWSYDAGGNVLQVGGMTRSFTYDAENRQVSATINTNTSNYTFDGLGQRVTKTSGGVTTVYVYDAFGNLAAEYSSQAGTSPCGTSRCYVSWDHLGSMRMLTDANGSSTVKRYDYLPFGGELLAGINGRTAGMGYYSNPDSTNPKFTGQMRDSETYDPNGGTANDWFIARTFSGAQGRFQSVDPGNAGADPSNPQTWNAYAYVGNNPLTYTDPSGRMEFIGAGAAIGSAGGPAGTVAGAIVGAVLDLGALFYGLFGGGGGSPPPPNWANVQQTTVSVNNPGEPWSEKPPFPLSVGPGGPYSNGFVPVLAGLGAAAGTTVCVGSGVCEIAGAVVIYGGTLYGAYKLGTAIGGAINKARNETGYSNHIVKEIQEIYPRARRLQEPPEGSVCTTLKEWYDHAGSSAERAAIKLAQKYFGCRGSNAQ